MKSNDKKSFLKKIQKTFCKKEVLIMFVMLVMAVSPLFGADTISSLDTWGQKILDIFTGTWVKALLMVALIIEAIMMVVSGQQGGGGQMFKKFGPWIVGTIILLSASGICTYFLDGLDSAMTIS